MSNRHEDEAAIRGHGIKVCDHECTRMELGRQPALWCMRCGALYIDGQWKMPSLRVQDSIAIRDRDTMHETLTIAQERGTALVEENRRLNRSIVAAGFRVANALLGEPTLWCIECERDSGYHHDGCSKAAR